MYVRTEASTRGHVFSVMLACMMERMLEKYWKTAECTVPEGIDERGAISSVIVTLNGASCLEIPEPTKTAQALLEAMEVRLPEVLEARNIEVVTRKKLSKSRN